MSAKKKIDVEITETAPVDLDMAAVDPAEAVYERIAEFEDTLPDRTYLWRNGDPAPEWMGPRPVWAEDHHHCDPFVPSRCFWQSTEINMPVLGLYGAKSDDGHLRSMGTYSVLIRQYWREREPTVIIRVGPKGEEYHLPLTLSEVDDLVAALEMMADIAKTADLVGTEAT